jgi:hypothetical protein
MAGILRTFAGNRVTNGGVPARGVGTAQVPAVSEHRHEYSGIAEARIRQESPGGLNRFAGPRFHRLFDQVGFSVYDQNGFAEVGIIRLGHIESILRRWLRKSVTCDRTAVQTGHFCPNPLDALQQNQ